MRKPHDTRMPSFSVRRDLRLLRAAPCGTRRASASAARVERVVGAPDGAASKRGAPPARTGHTSMGRPRAASVVGHVTRRPEARSGGHFGPCADATSAVCTKYQAVTSLAALTALSRWRVEDSEVPLRPGGVPHRFSDWVARAAIRRRRCRERAAARVELVGGQQPRGCSSRASGSKSVRPSLGMTVSTSSTTSRSPSSSA